MKLAVCNVFVAWGHPCCFIDGVLVVQVHDFFVARWHTRGFNDEVVVMQAVGDFFVAGWHSSASSVTSL